ANTFLEFIPGIIGITVLLFNGYTPRELFLIKARLSLKGALLLCVFFVVLIPILVTGKWIGFDPLDMFLVAILGGISQELYFRNTLLPYCFRILKRRRFLALVIHAILFSLWHLPLILIEAPLAGVIGVMIVTFIGGLVWGGQVQRDGTVYWAMGQHILYLMLMSMFTWG
ncbi:MAG: CPBP family intramembrane metalloprotease, partial [Dehalococcoidales bacterium]